MKVKHNCTETDEFTSFQNASEDLKSEARQTNAVKICQPNMLQESFYKILTLLDLHRNNKGSPLNFPSNNERI